MRVRMATTVSGSRDGLRWPRRGDEIELPDDEATSLCAAGIATPIPTAEVETRPAPTDDVETRSAPKAKPAPKGKAK